MSGHSLVENACQSHEAPHCGKGFHRGEAPQPQERTWKSGASAPRMDTSNGGGFSPRRDQGLKAATPASICNAALQGPLFHGRVSVPTNALITLLLAVIFMSPAHAQVTFDRLLNSAKE